MTMEKTNTVRVVFPSKWHHSCQIATGFLRLAEQGWNVELVNDTRNAANFLHGQAFVQAEYLGKRIIYDLLDGYLDIPSMQKALDNCDFYFKRSFSREKNQKLFPTQMDKIYPLGFNYHVTHRKNPINESAVKRYLKPFQGRAPDVYFTTEVFEGTARPQTGKPVILFLARLWEEEPELPEAVNAERRQINESRIQIIRTLKERYGDAFVGGLNDLPIARTQAPDLIMPAQYTERRRYVKLLHTADICIGTMGLHESIGWKTGEYVAAAKAIVNERFHYEVTGDFREGENYLPFETAQECLDAVQELVDSPEKLLEMKRRNQHYYEQYLKPEMLVKNGLEVIAKNI